jgi:Fe-S cluster assembly iron-binding protein IscA
MKITENAKAFVEGVLAQYDAKGIRVYAAGESCGNPKLGLTLDEPKEEDTIEVINGIRVAFETEVVSFAKTVTLDVQGSSLVLVGNSCCC